MTPNPRPPTARIYQFPVKPRDPAGAPRSDHARPADAWTTPAPRTDFGSGWYHDAAINGSDQGRKH